jgi:putative transposase
MINFKGHCIEKDIILLCVRWYLAYPLSYRNLEEMMKERGVQVDHSNIYRWVQKFTPPLEAAFRDGKKRPMGSGWRMDETYIKVKVSASTCIGLSTERVRPLTSCSPRIGARKPRCASLKSGPDITVFPEKMTIDQSGANTAAIEALVEETGQKIEIRQNKYLNNLVEQDHRVVKRIVRPMLGFKSFRSASLTLRGIELMHMLKKAQLIAGNSHNLSAAGQFNSLAA